MNVSVSNVALLGSRTLLMSLSAILILLAQTSYAAPIDNATVPPIRQKILYGNSQFHDLSLKGGVQLEIEEATSVGVERQQFNRVLHEVARVFNFLSEWFTPPQKIGLRVTGSSDNAGVALLRDDGDVYVSYLTMPYEMFIQDKVSGKNMTLTQKHWRSVLIHEVGHIFYREEIKKLEREMGKKLLLYISKPSYGQVEDALTEMFADLFTVVALDDERVIAEALSIPGQPPSANSILRDFTFGEMNSTHWESFYQKFGGLEGSVMTDRHLILSPARHWIWNHLLVNEKNHKRRMEIIGSLFRLVVENRGEWVASSSGKLSSRQLNELVIDSIKRAGRL